MGKVHISMGTTGGSRYILILGSWKFQIVMDYHRNRTRLVQFISSFIIYFFLRVLHGDATREPPHPMA